MKRQYKDTKYKAIKIESGKQLVTDHSLNMSIQHKGKSSETIHPFKRYTEDKYI
jgi:hypothetical protein